jgi:hypothetical protein
VFSQTKSDEWNLHASSRETTLVYNNAQIGIVTDDTPLKTKEIILNGAMKQVQKMGLVELLEELSFNLHLNINNQEISSSNIDN